MFNAAFGESLGRKPSRKSDKKKKGSSNYAYAVTRVRAMKSKLLPKETYPRLLNMGIDEITRFIQESEYKNDVDELAMRYSGGDLAEHALNRNLALTYDKLVRITTGELNYLIVAYLKDMTSGILRHFSVVNSTTHLLKISWNL